MIQISRNNESCIINDDNKDDDDDVDVHYDNENESIICMKAELNILMIMLRDYWNICENEDNDGWVKTM